MARIDYFLVQTPALVALLSELGFYPTASTHLGGMFHYDEVWKLELWLSPPNPRVGRPEEWFCGMIHLPGDRVTGNLVISTNRRQDHENLLDMLRLYGFPVDKVLRTRRLTALLA